jgi:hypothetical protein
MHRRRKLVVEQVPRIEDAEAVQCREPQFSIQRLADVRTRAAKKGTAPYSVGTVENGKLNRSFWILIFGI